MAHQRFGYGRFKLFFLVLSFIGLTSPTWAGACTQNSSSDLKCVEFERNYDGDTITVNIPNVHPLLGDHITVRVKGIDTAEIYGKKPCEKQMAKLAKTETKKFMKNARRIEFTDIERGKYFRIVADVHADGESLAEFLLKENLAVKYEGGTKPEADWCRL